MTLKPDEVLDLQWLASGEFEAELGDKSPLGAQLERLRAGTLRCSSGPPEGRDRGPAAERLSRVKRRLDAAESASPGSARVLLAFYGPRNNRALTSFLQLGLVMALCSEKETTALEADASKARKGDQGATARLTALRAKAEAAIAEAQRAYAETRSERRRAG